MYYIIYNMLDVIMIKNVHNKFKTSVLYNILFLVFGTHCKINNRFLIIINYTLVKKIKSMKL